tara:strand:- start:30 stop:626 length:597 start_codon:yes stop_codon:yes gene_type:complete
MSKELLTGPIPGQSLTDEPGNFPWEQPPETEKPEEALMMHIEKMSTPEFMEGASILMEIGVPVSILTSTSITGAVAEGIHSIDVGLIIADGIKKELVSIAKMSGVNYIEEFSDEPEVEQRQKANLKALVTAKLKKKSSKLDEVDVTKTMEAMTSPEVEALEDMQDQQEEGGPEMEQPPQEQQEEPVPEANMGLMSRGV